MNRCARIWHVSAFELDGKPLVAFDFASGECLGPIVRLPRLTGQALAFFLEESDRD
jgi:hypothetical protein